MGMPTMIRSQMIREGHRIFPESDGKADAPGTVAEMSRDGVTVTLALEDGRTLFYGYGVAIFASVRD